MGYLASADIRHIRYTFSAVIRQAEAERDHECGGSGLLLAAVDEGWEGAGARVFARGFGLICFERRP